MIYSKKELEKMMEENGGWLDLRGTQITSLPDNLTVGGSLDLRGTQIKNRNCKHLKDGDYVEGKYLYCDNILTHVKSRKVIGNYTFYIGKIKNKNVVCDGEHYAHCKTFKEGVLDIEFKKSKDRGAEQYENLTLESELTYDEAVIAYRIITGACRAGTQQFLDGLKEVKEKYKISEIISLTKGQYGASIFENFFNKTAKEN